MCSGAGEIIAPLGDVLGTDWLGDEIGMIAGMFGQRSVHLGSADAELARQHKEEDVGIGQSGWAVPAGNQRVVQISAQVI